MGDADDIAPKLGFNGYVFMAILFSFFFVIQHLVLHTILRITYQGYMRLTLRERHEYRMQWNAFFHAIFATWFSIYCAFYTCGDGKTFFNDEQCRLVPRNSHVWTCFFTAAYLTVETCFIVFKVGMTTPIDKQTFLHHVIAFSNYYIAFWKQDFTITIGAMFIFLEISTPFVCMRWILFHHGFKGSIT